MRNKKGFTLIELLAVIVILGLLLAIAIPSISKYVNQSRKKTVVSSIENYISSIITEVNFQKYNFSEPNIIFAVPINCISLERGGDNPFGEWAPASEDYWAYVLVQYNPEQLNYTYGFTFKDSNGYGMYPTTIDNLKNDGSQIKTGLDLVRPKSSFISDKSYWSDFKISDDTFLVIFENNTCDILPSCTSLGNDIGDIITCGTEEFYIIESDSSSVTMLAKERLNFTSYMQSASSGNSISFSLYWHENGSLKPEYGLSYPAYVYNSQSNLYKYIEGYEQNLKDLGVATAEAKLISSDQLVNNLKCTNYNCNNSPYVDWLKTSYNWWTGTATSSNCLWHVNTNGTLNSNSDCQGWRSIRPVITVNKKKFFIK